MPTSLQPMVMPSDGVDPRRLQAGEAVAGTARREPLLPLQPNGLAVSLGAEVLVSGTDFTWSSDMLPLGRSLYLETYAFGSLLGTLITATLYATTGATAGQAVAGASVGTTNTTTGALQRSGAFSLTDGVSYQLRMKTTLLGTGTLKSAYLLFL